jgi:serine O-acetyltransferase
MTYREYRFLVLSDLYRISNDLGTGALLRHLVRGSAFKYTFWMRTCRFTRAHPLCRHTIYHVARVMLTHYTYKFGISIPFETSIGSGFYIGHFGGIVVNENSVIGKNCNISHGVTLGESNRGSKKGCPVLGDNVYIGPGAKIVGNVRIGNDVAIGANCVVTHDVPDHSVVVGIPGRVISQDGSAGYVNRTDYDGKLRR